MIINKKKIIMIIIMIFILIFIIANSFIHSRNEFRSGYDFVINKIEVTPTGQLRLYDVQGTQFSFWNYSINNNDNIIVGDSIHKIACSEFLYIYKKANPDKYEEYQKMAPSTLFPNKWFCK
jgi:hypothetical protein